MICPLGQGMGTQADDDADDEEQKDQRPHTAFGPLQGQFKGMVQEAVAQTHDLLL